RPGERKFLGFSISNDGSERRIAPKALDKFKGRIRDMTRRTRGFGLQQLIKELKPYIVGWRGYFGFCQTPRVLTNLEAWIRRRLRLYLWRQWRTGQNRFAELRRRGVAKFAAAVATGSPTGLWRMSDIRRSNKPYATTISSRSVFPEPMRPPKPNSVEPPWYGPVCPVVWEGWRRKASPYPDLGRNPALQVAHVYDRLPSYLRGSRSQLAAKRRPATFDCSDGRLSALGVETGQADGLPTLRNARGVYPRVGAQLIDVSIILLQPAPQRPSLAPAVSFSVRPVSAAPRKTMARTPPPGASRRSFR